MKYSLLREHEFPQEFVAFIQFFKHGHCKFLMSVITGIITCKHTHTNIFVTPNALTNAAFATHKLQLVSTYVECGQRACISFRHFHQTHVDLYLSCAKHFCSPYNVCTRHVSAVLMVTSCDALFWNIFGTVHSISFQQTTPCNVPSLAGSWQLTWFTMMDAVHWKTMDTSNYWEISETLRVSLAHIVCLYFFIKILFRSKVVKIIYIHIICQIPPSLSCSLSLSSNHDCIVKRRVQLNIWNVPSEIERTQVIWNGVKHWRIINKYPKSNAIYKSLLRLSVHLYRNE